eukprot:529584-Pelagomonas_calceolata.AAC.3
MLIACNLLPLKARTECKRSAVFACLLAPATQSGVAIRTAECTALSNLQGFKHVLVANALFTMNSTAQRLDSYAQELNVCIAYSPSLSLSWSGIDMPARPSVDFLSASILSHHQPAKEQKASIIVLCSPSAVLVPEPVRNRRHRRPSPHGCPRHKQHSCLSGRVMECTARGLCAHAVGGPPAEWGHSAPGPEP